MSSGRWPTALARDGGGDAFVSIAAARRIANGDDRLAHEARAHARPAAGLETRPYERRGGAHPTRSRSRRSRSSPAGAARTRSPTGRGARAAGRARDRRLRPRGRPRERRRACEKPTNARLRSSGASGQTISASVATPPTQIRGGDEMHPVRQLRDGAGVPFSSLWPESERPLTRTTDSASAGQRSAARSKIHASMSVAATTAKPTVITRKATPNRVLSANGFRSL